MFELFAGALLLVSSDPAPAASSAIHNGLVAPAPTQAELRYAIVPQPVTLTARDGSFRLRATTTIQSDAQLASVARWFARELAAPLGFEMPVRTGATQGGVIRLVRDTALRRLGAEGYRLDVTPTGVVIRASKPAGAFYALQTLRQLLPPASFRRAVVAGQQWTIPAVHIEDAPRFAWRGSHLDAARHFMPKEFVRKYIDLLALHKMNRFHWHLTDDQGWRLQIRQYPKLTDVGSCREQTLVGPHTDDPAKQVFDKTPHCGFYTQDDVREIVAYAAERFITVVPEIEMPGHAQAAIFAYPELGVRPDTNAGVRQTWGVSEFILNAEPSTITFMQNVLSEVLELFPGQYIHVGGDEATKTQWKASPQIQQRIKTLGLKDEHELQSWFIRQMDDYLTKHGRRLIGWDEILEGGLAENATVMSWRGTAGGIAAARAGHDVVMAPNAYTYFDHYQTRNRTREPLAIGGFLPLDTVYAFEPVPTQLNDTEAKHILGAQAQLWAEYLLNPKQVEYMAYPRMVALAEVLWTPKSKRDFADFRTRLDVHLRRLDVLDVNYRRPDR